MPVGQLKYFRKQLYDTLNGRFVRDIKPTDVVNLTAFRVAGASGTIIAQTALNSNNVAFITAFSASAIGAAGEVYVTVGTSTVLPMALAQNAPISLIGSKDSPLVRVAASSTITIYSQTANSTISAMLTLLREPTFTRIETA